MQALGAITHDQLNLAGQELLYKFEVWDDSAWIDLCSLGGLNYLVDKSLSMNLGGAGVSPDPIAGTWSATISNDDGIFHPRHPSSIYSSLLRVGRKVRISVGANYGGAVYWQRMAGYMDAPKFNNTKRQVSLSGMDYMKPLADTALRSPDNYWGASATFSTVASIVVLGSEIYDEADALEIGAHEANNLTNWVESEGGFTPIADAGGGSSYVARLMSADEYTAASGYDDNVGSFTAGTTYTVSFKYKRVKTHALGNKLSCFIYKTGTGYSPWGSIANLTSEVWTTTSFQFTCPETAAGRLTFKATAPVLAGTAYIYIDEVSIKPHTSDMINAIYELPAASNGPYYVTLDTGGGAAPIFFGSGVDDWTYSESTRTLEFSIKRVVAAGTNNLVVYYYTTQQIVDVLGDLLMASGLYASRAAALAAMDYTDPLLAIPKVWFDAGTSCLLAVQKVCERCDYRFWMDEAGVPHFKPAPTHGDPAAWFSTRTVAEYGDFQDIEEVRNRVVIEGIEQGAFSTAKDKKTSRLVCAATSDAASIAAYREKTHSITNDLFQDQAALDAMAVTLLAFYKDPKLYTDLPAPHNPIPIERGDTVEWDIELRVPDGGGTDAGLKNTVRGIVRDISFSGDGFTYKCEMRSTAMNVANYATTPVTVTSEHCKGWTLTNAGAGADVHFDLPAAAVGMEITFHVRAAQTLTVDPNGTDRIAVLTDTNGDYLRSDAVVGSYLKLVCLVVNVWSKSDISGTWTEE